MCHCIVPADRFIQRICEIHQSLANHVSLTAEPYTAFAQTLAVRMKRDFKAMASQAELSPTVVEGILPAMQWEQQIDRFDHPRSTRRQALID